MQPDSVKHVYAHVPFCPRVCPYCAFYVVPADRRVAGPAVDALLAEWAAQRARHAARPVTLYLGGGTPSALPTRDLARLAAALVADAKPEEFTLEVNPTTISAEKARAMVDLGLTRASLGAQSFDPADLATLGRQHGPDRIAKSYDILRDAGVRALNIDLIYGTPGQTLASWESSLRRACALGPDHLSAYALTYEEDTPFFERVASGAWRGPDHDRDERMYRAAVDLLASHGLRQYEVSNFARPGMECAHNMAAWRGADYLGIGPGAVSTVRGRRWRNRPDVAAHIAASPHGPWPTDSEETIGPDTWLRERYMFGLRTIEGVRGDAFPDEMRLLEQHGYAQRTPAGWRLTPEGLLRADAIAERFAQG